MYQLLKNLKNDELYFRVCILLVHGSGLGSGLVLGSGSGLGLGKVQLNEIFYGDFMAPKLVKFNPEQHVKIEPNNTAV